MSRGISWTSYAMGGALAIILSWIMTGCRFGNHQENTPGKPADTLSGYYSTELVTFRACAVTEDGQGGCGLLPGSGVPDPYATYLHDPLFFYQQDTSSGKSYLMNPWADQAQGIGVTARASDRTFKNEDEQNFLFWDGHCLTQDHVTLAGSLNSKDSGKQMSGKTISGHAVILVTDTFSFDSATCGPARNELYACYIDETLCGAGTKEGNQELHENVVAFFRPYLDHGALNEKDIPLVSKMVLEISYE